jgi:DhnA family fructose-bisphosphate aldolase class Ia
VENIRYQRLFNRNERAVIVAMDHCLFEGPLEGMTDLAETASRVAPCVDGILLSPGNVLYLAEFPGGCNRNGIFSG